ncbi:MAG: nitroreductase family protein [Candidatus Thorarchaeota archaeon]
MNDFYNVINSRRTIREYKEKEIPCETIRNILECGFKAPSNDHTRRWEFILIDDMNTKTMILGEKGENNLKPIAPQKIIEEWGFDFEDELQKEIYFKSIPIQAQMILTAPVVLVPCFFQPQPLLSPTQLRHLNYFASIWMCIENILLAAAAEGIFGVTMIPNKPQKIKKLLNIPKKYEIACLLPLGYPKEDAWVPRQYEIQIEDRIRMNSWD